jgi:hypothetical protein
LLDNAILDSEGNYGFPNTNQVADHLIANGATVQEWISVKDRLPEKNEFDWVLVVVELHSQYGIFHSVPIVAELRHGEWYDYNDETIEGEFEKVTHWMPLPQPPKGE